jgi:hypothetical protein
MDGAGMRRWIMLAATAATLAAAAPVEAADVDYDGDGVVAGDCRPLDAAFHPGADDRPDLAFEDLDCDGIDGDPSEAVFVVPSGNDLNPGTRGQPVASLTKAVQLASAAGKDVYAAVGGYGHTAMVGEAYTGVGIYGGYEAPGWTRTRAFKTTVTDVHEAMLVERAFDVELQLLTLAATKPDDPKPEDFGKSTYGLRAVSAEVALVGSSFSAEGGFDGAPGKAAAPAPGAPQIASPGGSPQCGNVPGAGGSTANPGGGLARGGAGGAGGSSDDDGNAGKKGSQGDGNGVASGGVGGDGGEKVNDEAKASGKDGSSGTDGLAGDPGDGGASTTASSVEGAWKGADGEVGDGGNRGSAGGGGGGGAGRTSGWDYGSGAGGGQGGHGGRPGAGGAGGYAAGGSFGVYLHKSAAVAHESSIAAGPGGTGGAGAKGQTGGPGGRGGLGGNAPDCGITIGDGGDGGKGGSGGDGGRGGNGAGGPSAGVFRETRSFFAQRGSTLTKGSGGPGGAEGEPGDGFSELVAGGYMPGDFDGDGVDDGADPCPTASAPMGCPARGPALADSDGDGIPDSYEDDDGDGLRNGLDACPAEAAPGRADGCLEIVKTEPATGPGAGTESGPGPGSVFGPGVKLERVGASVTHRFIATTRALRFRRLVAKRVPAGGAVEVRCKGRKCPRKRWTAKGPGKVKLKPFSRRWLPLGTTLEIRLTKPGMIGKVLRYKLLESGPLKTELCLPPGSATPERC